MSKASSGVTNTNTPTFVDGIGPPLEQIEEDYRFLLDSTCGGMAEDILALIAEVYRLRAMSPPEAHS